MNNVYWATVNDTAVVLPPGELAGDGRCEAGEWGIAVQDVVVYGPLADLRGWARSVQHRLPPERGGAPLIVVDETVQWQWLCWSGVLGATEQDACNWTATVETVHDLIQRVILDPAQAGWSVGTDVAVLWAELDDATGGLAAGVQLTGTGHQVGIVPLTDEDLTVRLQASSFEIANACLTVIADRVNQSY